MTDTITAISTGSAISAIGIIRISGPDSIKAADSIFRGDSIDHLTSAENRKLYYGKLIDSDGVTIDLCLCTISRAPNSYTGEDTAEFQCHGSPVILAECLKTLHKIGIRSALPGEFTKRAFLNGRMDLTQAEAVIDLIEAETPNAARNAAGQLGGTVRIKLDPIYNQLLDIIAHFHAVIDYPDEDIDDFMLSEYLTTLRESEEQLSKLHATFERGSVLKNGIPTAIIGRPNAGKSSLLNAFLGYDRAIVTEIPGTTRDTIEEKIRLGSVTIKLIDTAGIRNTADAVEKIGVQRSLDALSNATLVLIILDGSVTLGQDDLSLIKSTPDKTHKIIVINKSDLPQKITRNNILNIYPKIPIFNISAKTGDGLKQLEEEIKRLFDNNPKPPQGELLTNARQAETLTRTIRSIQAAQEALSIGMTPDAALCEVESALSSIGEITGKTMREDVTTRIFERFCVGK